MREVKDLTKITDEEVTQIQFIINNCTSMEVNNMEKHQILMNQTKHYKKND